MASSTSLQDQIRIVFHDAIANDSIAPGSILLEAPIADALSTSRSPVRAALGSLKIEGRLAKLAGRGYIVLERNGAMPRVRGERLSPERIRELAGGDVGSKGDSPPAAWSRILTRLEGEIAAAAKHGPLRIAEPELARHFGVSRTVVREALARLERGGLVQKGNRLPWRVTPLTLERIRQIYELRRMLEPVALRRATERGGYHGAAGMRERLAAARKRLPDVSAGELLGFERELHVDALKLCDNVEIVRAIRAAHAPLATNARLVERLRSHFGMILTDHLAVADRLAAGDTPGAAEALTDHLGEDKAEALGREFLSEDAQPEPLPRYLQPA